MSCTLGIRRLVLDQLEQVQPTALADHEQHRAEPFPQALDKQPLAFDLQRQGRRVGARRNRLDALREAHHRRGADGNADLHRVAGADLQTGGMGGRHQE